MEKDDEPGNVRTRAMRAARAKHQTVLITPDMANQFRSMFGKEGAEHSGFARPGKIEEGWQSPIADGSHSNDNSDHSASERQADDASYAEDGAWDEEQFGGDRESPEVDENRNVSATLGVAPSANRDGIFKPRLSELGRGGKQTAGSARVDVMPSSRELSSHGRGSEMSKQNFKHESNVSQVTARTLRTVSKGELTKLIGFLVSFDVEPNGEVSELRVGRWILTNKVVSDSNCVVVVDDSISQLHAIVRVTADGKVQILDQLSEVGTGITRVGSEEEEELVGAMALVGHGDKIRFGKRIFYLCLLPSI